MHTLDSYLLGDHNLPWWAILGSILAAETSTATVLSVPGEAYGPTGMKFLQLALGYIVGRFIIVYTLLPLYFRGKLFTAYEVLEKRFGGATKQTASLLFLVTRNLGDGLRLYLAATALHTLAGLPFEFSVLLMGIVTMIYTFYGGIRSVVWNDCLQFVIYMLGAVVAVIVILRSLSGGWSELYTFAVEHGKFQVFDFRWDLGNPYTFWAGLVGGAVLTIGTHGADHMMVQRYLSARSQSDAGRAIIVSGFMAFGQFALFLLIGVGLASYYARFPDVTFASKDAVFADFIVHAFPRNTGLIGLMLAAILAAALSSSLNASASAMVNDFYVPWRGKELPSEHLYRVTRWLTIVFGFVQIGIGILALHFSNTVVTNALTIAGFSAGVLLGVFALGVFARRAGQIAAVSGMLIGLATLSYLHFLAPLHGTKVAFPWFALLGATTTFLSGLALSALFPHRGAIG